MDNNTKNTNYNDEPTQNRVISERIAWAEHELDLASAQNDDYSSLVCTKEYKDMMCSCFAQKNKFICDHAELVTMYGGQLIDIILSDMGTLLSGRPLTPLTNDDSEWKKTDLPHSDIFTDIEINTRYPDLSRYSRTDHPENKLYFDHNRHVIINRISHRVWTNKDTVPFILSEINARYPIALPYMPSVRPDRVYTEVFSTTGVIGTHQDTILISHIISSNGKKESFISPHGVAYKKENNEWVPISDKEYTERKTMFTQNKINRQEDLFGEDFDENT